MAYSRIVAVGDGTTKQFAVNFALDYLQAADVTCRVGNEVDGSGAPAYRTITFLSTNLVQISGTAPGTGVRVVFERTVDKDKLRVDYNNGDQLDEDNLMTAQMQAMMAVHEVLDGRFSVLTQELDAGGNSVVNLRAPVLPADASTKAYTDSKTAEALGALDGTLAAAAVATEQKDIAVAAATTTSGYKDATAALLASTSTLATQVSADKATTTAQATAAAASAAAAAASAAAAAAITLTYMLSVKDNGAVGNGVANDTAGIQATINKVRDNGGGTVVFPAGSYSVTGSLTLYSNIRIWGPGAVITQKANNTAIFVGNNLTNIWFEDIECVGTGWSDTAPTAAGVSWFSAFATAIYMANPTNIYISKCRFRNFLSGGIILGYANKVYIGNNTITGVYQGAGDTKTPPGNGEYAAFGIYIFAGNSGLSGGLGDFHIVDNTITTTCHGIFVGPGYTRVNISGNTIRNLAQHGMYVNAGDGFVASNNNISDVAGNGIKVQNGTVSTYFTPQGIIVANNNCFNVGGGGAWGVIVDTITNAGDQVATIYHKGVIVANNSVHGFAGGVYVGHARNSSVTGNTVSNCAGIGVQAIGYEGFILNNRVKDVWGAGIAVSPEHYKRVVISGNLIDGSNQNPGGGSDISLSPSALYTWTASTYYAAGKYVQNGTQLYFVLVPGVSASSGGPTGTGGSIADGTVTWAYQTTVATADPGEVHLMDNTITLNSTDFAAFAIFIGGAGLKFYWRNNTFLSSATVNIASATLLGDDNNWHAGYASVPSNFLSRGHRFRQFTGQTVPASGAYNRGDIMWYDTPVGGGFIGYVCVASGSPGTWKSFGAITA